MRTKKLGIRYWILGFAIFVFGAVMMSGPAWEVGATDGNEMVVELLRLRAILEDEVPGLRGMDDFEKAVVLRDHIHQNMDIKSGIMVDWSRPAQIYLESRRGKLGHLCGGFVILYLAALESQGIPGRYVGLFDSDQQPYRSHATAEFWYRGRWYAGDPTLNAMYAADGHYLSYVELFEIVQMDGEYEVINNGRGVRNEVQALAADLEGLMGFMMIHPAGVWEEGRRYDYGLTLLPEGWDGKVGEMDVVEIMHRPPYTELQVLR